MWQYLQWETSASGRCTWTPILVITIPLARQLKAPSQHPHDSPDHNFLENWGTVCFIFACLSLEQCPAYNHHPGNLLMQVERIWRIPCTHLEKESSLRKCFSSLHLVLTTAIQLSDQWGHRRPSLSCCHELDCPAVPSMMGFLENI